MTAILDTIIDMLSLSFMTRAIIVGVLVSLSASLLGASLVLKRYSMIGDGLSHVGFGALAVSAAMNWAPLQVSVPVVVLAAFLLLRISQNSKVRGDAAIAMLSSSSIAIGMIVVSVAGVNIDVNSYMFGSILALSESDVWLSIGCSAIVVVLFLFFYSKIFAVTFDENFARATGVRARLYNMLIALLTAFVIVVGMRLMGALLISSLIIFPSLTSMRVCRSFKGVTIFAAVVSIICFLTGITLTFFFDLPTGACIVVVNLIAFIICAAIGNIRLFTSKTGK